MAEEIAPVADLAEARALRAAAAGDPAALDALWWSQRALLWRALCAHADGEEAALPLFVALHRERREALRALAPGLGAELAVCAALSAWLRARGGVADPRAAGRLIGAVGALSGRAPGAVAAALGLPAPRPGAEARVRPALLTSAPPALPVARPRRVTLVAERRALLLLLPAGLWLGLAARSGGPPPVDPCAGPGGPLRSGAPGALVAAVVEAGAPPVAAAPPRAPTNGALIGVEHVDPVMQTWRYELGGQPLRAGRAPAPLALPRAGVVEGPGGPWALRRARDGAAGRCWATPAGPGAEALLDAAVRGAATP